MSVTHRSVCARGLAGVSQRDGADSAQRRDGYERRQPEQTLLYQIIAEHWSSFRERAEQAGGLPKFVVDEFEAYLRCGILKHGLAHLACSRCGHSMVVAYSCKRRGLCPSACAYGKPTLALAELVTHH